MKDLLIKNGTIIDPSQNLNEISDIYVEQGVIKEIGKNLNYKGCEMIDANGLYVCPGLIDMHVHLRDPGQTHKEDIFTGSNAAAKGGFTTIACMPNTYPPIDSEEMVDYINKKAKDANANVAVVACVTVGMKGKVLTEFKKLKNAGACALSDDGQPFNSAEIIEQAALLSKEIAIPIISHCEDKSIVNGGIINKGKVSEQLGVKGIDSFSEDSITSREICIANNTNAHIHIAHVSTKGATRMIKKAKDKGVKITAETCPHYFCLTENMLLKKDANYRMNPPLREEFDRKAILRGLLDGTFDMIVTDHAPHTEEEKANFETAPNGVIGLETALGLCLSNLVHQNSMSISDLIKLMSTNPAKIFNLDGGTLKEGKKADIVIIDPNKEWTVRKEDFCSKSKNSPFVGFKLKGKAVYTILKGKVVYKDR